MSITTIAGLTPDNKNANKGTQRGTGMLEESLRRFGAGRSILADKNLRVIAGNKTLEGAAAIGLEDVIVVPSDGTKLVVVQRTDLDLDDPKTREFAVHDNRVGQVNLEWDAGVLAELAQEGIELDDLWSDNELNTLLGNIPDPDDPREHWADMPEFEQDDELPHSVLIVQFGSEDDRLRFMELMGEKPDRVKSIWYPHRDYLKQSR